MENEGQEWYDSLISDVPPASPSPASANGTGALVRYLDVHLKYAHSSATSAFGIADLAAQAEAIAAAFGLPRTFAELGAPRALIARAVPRVMESRLLDNNPERPTKRPLRP